MNLSEWEKKAEKYKNVRVFQCDESFSLGKCLNFAVEKSIYQYVAKFDDDYYGPNYLINVVNAFEHSDADIVGKSNIFVYFNNAKILATHKRGKENSFTSKFIAGATINFKKEIFDKVKFQHLPSGTDRVFVTECLSNGFKVYSTDIYDYSCIRDGNVEMHTWKIEDDAFMKWCKPVKKIKISKLYDIFFFTSTEVI